jgi:hypothetical protein
VKGPAPREIDPGIGRAHGPARVTYRPQRELAVCYARAEKHQKLSMICYAGTFFSEPNIMWEFIDRLDGLLKAPAASQIVLQTYCII